MIKWPAKFLQHTIGSNKREAQNVQLTICSKKSERNKKQALTISKKNLDLRLSGISGVEVGLYNREKSSFSGKRIQKDLIHKNSKIKILICTHDFLDSIHVNGKNFFPDFYLLLNFL